MVDDPYNMYYTPDGKSAIVVAEARKRLDFRDPQTMAMQYSIDVPGCKGINHADFSIDGRHAIFTCEFSGHPREDRPRRAQGAGLPASCQMPSHALQGETRRAVRSRARSGSRGETEVCILARGFDLLPAPAVMLWSLLPLVTHPQRRDERAARRLRPGRAHWESAAVAGVRACAGAGRRWSLLDTAALKWLDVDRWAQLRGRWRRWSWWRWRCRWW
jgi:hypothetical protein